MRPADGLTMPEMTRSVVVLPAPLAPSSATTSPAVDREVHVPDDSGLVVARSQPFDLKHRAHETAPASTPSSADTSAPAAPRYALITCGSAADGLRRPVCDDLAELEHDDVVGDGQDEAHVVIDEQRRRALVDGLAQMAAERFALERVESGGRLVEAEQTR